MKLEKMIFTEGAVQRTGTIVEHKTEEMQSGAVYIIVLYSFTVVCLLVYPVPKPSLPGKLLKPSSN